MAAGTVIASLTIYSLGPKPSAGSSDDFGKPLPPVPIYTPNPGASPAASLAAAAAVPVGSVPIAAPLLTPDLGQTMVLADGPTRLKHTIVRDPDAPNAEKQYLHAVITKIDPTRFWLDQFERTVDVDVPAGQKLVLRITARSPTVALRSASISVTKRGSSI